MRRLIVLVFALACGGVAVYFMRQYLAEQQAALQRERQRLLAEYQSPVQVLVAAKDLQEGLTLDASHVQPVQIPEKFVQPYAARSPGDLAGLVTMAPIAEGEQVLVNKLRRAEAAPKDATLSSVMPEGTRAVTIAIDAISGVGGFVRPGDLVDLLWTIQLPAEGPGQQGQLATLTLFQGIPVLAVGSDMAGRGRAKAMTTEEVRTVTLAMTPQATSFLLFAREQGRIQLALRSRSDSEPATVVPANINTLMETVLGPAAGPQPKAAKAARQVEIYKGLQRAVVSLPEGDSAQ